MSIVISLAAEDHALILKGLSILLAQGESNFNVICEPDPVDFFESNFQLTEASGANIIACVHVKALHWINELGKNITTANFFICSPSLLRFNSLLNIHKAQEFYLRFVFCNKILSFLAQNLNHRKFIDLGDFRFGCDALKESLYTITGMFDVHIDTASQLRGAWHDIYGRSFDLKAGRTLSFSTKLCDWNVPLESRWPVTKVGFGRVFLGSGWSSPEERCVWSTGTFSTLFLSTNNINRDKILYRIKGYTAGHDFIINIRVNNELIETILFDSGMNNRLEFLIQVPVPISANEGMILVGFEFSKTLSPKRAGISSDVRELAIALYEIVIEKAPQNTFLQPVKHLSQSYLLLNKQDYRILNKKNNNLLILDVKLIGCIVLSNISKPLIILSEPNFEDDLDFIDEISKILMPKVSFIIANNSQYIRVPKMPRASSNSLMLSGDRPDLIKLLILNNYRPDVLVCRTLRSAIALITDILIASNDRLIIVIILELNFDELEQQKDYFKKNVEVFMITGKYLILSSK